MQFSSSLLAFGLASMSSAAVLPRETGQFTVTNFDFSGTPHSTTAVYSFKVGAQYDNILTSAVECLTRTNTSPDITLFNLTACSDPNYSFSWTLGASPNTTVFTIQHLIEGKQNNQTGSREFSFDDVKTSAGTTPTGDVQYLDTGDNGQFTISAPTTD